jgi:2-polyprenyl-3-methyl-5-hydroxy-6-metoxy-1,4-benzoquinol methylase
MEKLLSDQLKTLWQAVDQKHLTVDAFMSEQERLLVAYRQMWEQALCLAGYQNLSQSLLAELGSYMGCADIAEMQRQCVQALATLKDEWHEKVDPGDRQSIEQFYNTSQATIYELMWWHTLGDDDSPLAYIMALDFAKQQGCQRYLDFGAGVGSGGILFARHGLDVTIADISSALLGFSQWRLALRGLFAASIDLKVGSLPSSTFDFITAMDVFEHLVDPVETVERLWDTLKSGGFLYARINAEPDEDRPQHIVQDFGPTFERIRALGFVQVWQDEWLWGHQVFQKL